MVCSATRRDRPPASTPASSASVAVVSSRCSRAGSPSGGRRPERRLRDHRRRLRVERRGEEPGEPGDDRGPRTRRLRPAVPGAPVPGLGLGLLHLLQVEPGRLPAGRGRRRVRRGRGEARDQPLRHHARRRGLPDADPLGDGQPGAADLRLRRDAGRLRRALELPGRGDHLLRHRPAGRRGRDRERRPLRAQPDRPAHDPGRRVGRALAGVLRRQRARRPATARCSSSSATRRAPGSAPASRA